MSECNRVKQGNKKKENISDDEYLEQCIQANQQCFHSTCKKSTTLIKLQCQLCNQYFCTTHMLPEVHGCGNAARKAASAPAKKPVNEEKSQQLESKLSKKIERMQNGRKKKGK